MEIHCQVNAFMHAKFQCNLPSNYGVIVIVRKLTPLHFCTWYVHIAIVQYLVEGMKLPYKKTASESVEWLLRYKHLKSASGQSGPLILRFFRYIEKTSLARCARSLVIKVLFLTKWH